MNRRKFIRNASITTAGVSLSTVIPRVAEMPAISPSDNINVALVGCRNMGFGILQHHLSNPG
ncbi:MAG TPA: oxidoreductase, partial [Bacteroidales bacterium]|nr:oxidoreductase [Bacteroidales bacterium]